MLPLLAQSQVFVAVGALHLPGDQGLVSLLRENGYILKPEPLPLRSPDS
ncbi:MAG: TraB/GumN family protein [Proteobacteria bacterium]|nr:TraB/GumN family protein [Pseudomonadota bacterium]